MPKHIVYTKITPLPSNVPRQLALDMLHSHGEIIELNPLVTGHKPISAPRDAARDEFFAQWYEIEEVITWGLGMRKKISFKGVFHDMPWGLQTHIYAPMGVDLRNKYQIAGNEPGEPREVRELGIDAPADGLYLREDVEISCNIALASFVKKETKQTLLTMIDRMTKKAELLDDGVLQAMFKDGKLKTRNPQLAQAYAQVHEDQSTRSSVTLNTSSPASTSPSSLQSDFTPIQTFTKYSHLPGRTNTQRTSQVISHGMYSPPGSEASQMSRPYNNAVEMEGSSIYYDSQASAQTPPAELPDTSAQLDPRHPSAQSSNIDGSGDLRRPAFHTATSASSQYSKTSLASTISATPAPLQVRSPDPSGQMRAPSGSSQYVIVNPDQPSHDRTLSNHSVGPQEVQKPTMSPPLTQQQQNYPSAAYQPYSRSAAQASGAEQLANQVGRLSVSGTQSTAPQPTTNDSSAPKMAIKCPICSDFEGDSAAVSHHVNRSHFQ